MNNYSPCGNFIIDATGKQWAVETWHALPVPVGIEYNLGNIVKAGPIGECTHWLAHPKLPPVPRPKSREELDEEAFVKWQHGPDGYSSAIQYKDLPVSITKATWMAALAYARREGK